MTSIDIEGLHRKVYKALDDRDDELLREVGEKIAEHAHLDLPSFHATLNALGFHNKIEIINELMRAAWKQFQGEPAYSRSAVQAFAARAADHLIYAYLPGAMDGGSTSDELIVEIERYFALDRQRLSSYIQLLSGRVGRQWSSADFEPLSMPSMNGLMVEFMGFAGRAGTPHARAHLVREVLPRYFMDRQAGHLQPKPNMAEALRQGRRPVPLSTDEPPHPLVPDKDSMELFLKRVLQTVRPQSYAAAATVMLLPRWFHFLDARHLVPHDVSHQNRDWLFNLRQELAPYWSDHPDGSLRVDS